ncbi:hypothetical protein [Sphingobacterium sp. JUb56]|uniref:hypothetical protein n=1 Tax=Sphingobacterium sp. JUb56 TaxID=2587145 RepID=UPI00161F0EEB|nr:hypothetical protein [Sphingobacterium sp. JUb56]MBB2951599.1 hypothetical protein [Sphingobacterium sp. JUb56]
MFEKFQEAVRNAYLDLKNNNQLDSPRESPSTGDLKNWCQQCLERGLTKEDEAIFKTFFNDSKSTDRSLKEIVKNFDADKLRPLRYFIINDKAKRPDRNYVNLLAVLVDFSPRPYNFNDWNDNSSTKKPPIQTDTEDDEKKKEEVKGNDIKKATGPSTEEDTSKEESTKIEKGINDPDPTGQHENTAASDGDKSEKVVITKAGPSVDTTEVSTPSPIKGKTFFRNKTYYPYGGLAIVIIAIVIFSFINKECMCWNGIKYIKVDCRDNTQPNQIIGLNEDKLNNFEKIMKPDTLTKADVGKVWYSKIENEVEFFTLAGHHPVHNKKSLKAATEHIINTWAGRKSVNLDNKSIESLP